MKITLSSTDSSRSLRATIFWSEGSIRLPGLSLDIPGLVFGKVSTFNENMFICPFDYDFINNNIRINLYVIIFLGEKLQGVPLKK